MGQVLEELEVVRESNQVAGPCPIEDEQDRLEERRLTAPILSTDQSDRLVRISRELDRLFAAERSDVGDVEFSKQHQVVSVASTPVWISSNRTSKLVRVPSAAAPRPLVKALIWTIASSSDS